MLVAPHKPVQVKDAAVNPILKVQRTRTIAGKASAGPSESTRNMKYSQSSAKLATEREMLANRNTTDLRRRRLSSNLLADLDGSSSMALIDPLRRIGSTDLLASSDAPIPMVHASGHDDDSSSNSSSDESVVEAIEELVPLHLMEETDLVLRVAQGTSAEEIRLWLRRVCPKNEADSAAVLLSMPASPSEAATLALDSTWANGTARESRPSGRVVFPSVQDGHLHRQIIGLQWEKEWRVSFTQTLHKPEELMIRPTKPAASESTESLGGSPPPQLLSRRPALTAPFTPAPAAGSPRLKVLTSHVISLNSQSPASPAPTMPLRSLSPAMMQPRKRGGAAIPKRHNPSDLVEVPSRLKEALALCRNPPPIVGHQSAHITRPPSSHRNQQQQHDVSTAPPSPPIPSITPRDLVAGAKKVAEGKLHVRQFIVNFAHELSKRSDLVSLHLHHAPLGLYESVYLMRRGLCAMQYCSLQRLILTSCGIDGAALIAILAWVSQNIAASTTAHQAVLSPTSKPPKAAVTADDLFCPLPSEGSDTGVDGALFDLSDDDPDNAPEQLHTLDLSHNIIRSKDLPILCDIILRCPSIVVLSIKDNPICEETEDVQLDAPPSPEKKDGLKLPHPPPSAAIGGAAAGTATITVRANREFANLLALTPQLESLDVGFCNLGDGEVIKLCHRLFERKCSILRLCIDGADITTPVSTLLLETIQANNRSLFEFSAKYVCNCSTFSFKKKVGAAIRRNIRHCMNKGTESTLFNYLRRNERLAVPPHPILERMLAEAKVSRNYHRTPQKSSSSLATPTKDEPTPISHVKHHPSTSIPFVHVEGIFDNKSSSSEEEEEEEEDLSLHPILDDDEDKQDHVMRDWGGWDDRGLREGYHGYTSNDPSLAKRGRGHVAAKARK